MLGDKNNMLERKVGINGTTYSAADVKEVRHKLFVALSNDGLDHNLCVLVNNYLAAIESILDGKFNEQVMFRSLHSILISYLTLLNEVDTKDEDVDTVREAISTIAPIAAEKAPAGYEFKNMPIPPDSMVSYMLW